MTNEELIPDEKSNSEEFENNEGTEEDIQNDWITIGNIMKVLGFNNEFFSKQKELSLRYQFYTLLMTVGVILIILFGAGYMVAKEYLDKSAFQSIILISIGVLIDRSASIRKSSPSQ